MTLTPQTRSSFLLVVACLGTQPCWPHPSTQAKALSPPLLRAVCHQPCFLPGGRQVPGLHRVSCSTFTCGINPWGARAGHLLTSAHLSHPPRPSWCCPCSPTQQPPTLAGLAILALPSQQLCPGVLVSLCTAGTGHPVAAKSLGGSR